MTREERARLLAVALHEAGHAIADAARGRPPSRATANPHGGEVIHAPPRERREGSCPPDRQALAAGGIAAAAVQMAGAAAVRLRAERRPEAAWVHVAPWARRLSSGDVAGLAGSDDLLRQAGLNPGACDLLAREWADFVLSRNAATVARVARALMREREMDAPRLAELCAPAVGDLETLGVLLALADRALGDRRFALDRPA